ncbi:MAG: alkaline phosphatase family protein [Gemmatimonadota bacterium]
MTILEWHRTTVPAAALALLAMIPASPLAAQAMPQHRTQHVILLTIDGVRGQELFGGMDSMIAAGGDSSGIHDVERLRRDYWRQTAEARRRALMPWFWDSLVPRGILYGDRQLESPASITNHQGFSAPGYLEILTGEAQPDVTSNDRRRYGHRTILEYVRRRLSLPATGVAAITSWENFHEYVASDSTAVLVSAGLLPVPLELLTPAIRELDRLSRRAVPLWDGTRLDAFTGAIALEYLKRQRPTLLFISFDDTDDLAHSRRYDRLLDAFHGTDDFLRELWHVVQSTSGLKDQTTLVVTTDHGRGFTMRDWTDHGHDVPGSEQIWIAIMGPDTPALGEARQLPVHQDNIAATLLQFLGLKGEDFNAHAGLPLPRAFGPASRR